MNKIYFLTLLSVVYILLPFRSFSQSVEISGELKTWHKVTLSFTGPSTSELDALNPFLDYRLNVRFSNGTHTYVVPGYYAANGNAAESSADTGNVWRVHFSPDTLGLWSYKASFRTAPQIAISNDSLAGVADTLIDGKQGLLMIEETDKSGNDHRAKGMLRYVGNHYLQFARSKTWFIKGGSNSPENFLGYFEFDNTEDFGGVETPGLINGLHQYAPHVADWNVGDPLWQGTKGKGIIGSLNYLAAQGINSVYFLTYNTDGGDGQDTYMWRSPNDKKRYDCSKLDQWEIVFEQMDSLGIQLHVVTQETENNGAMSGLSIDRKLYYRELVARFGHHLALQWNIGEENSNSTSERKMFAEYIRKLDPYNHPIVIHSTYDNASSYYNELLGDANYEGTSIQGSGNNYNSWAVELRNRSAQAGRKWMIYGDEQAPEVNPDLSNQDKLRKIYWQQLLGGGAGCEWYFGYQGTFGDVQSEDFRIIEPIWQEMTIAREFWERYIPFYEMEPNNNLVQGNAYAFTKNGEVFAIYLPNGGSTQLNLQNNTDTLAVQWFNPRTGGTLQQGSITEVLGSGWVNIGNPPENGGDWVALVGSSNRAPSFQMQPAVLQLNMNFVGQDSTMAVPDPLVAGELTDTAIYSISPDTISFAHIVFDSIRGKLLVTAIPDSSGEQLFTITADDGKEFNNIAQQTFLLRVSPPLPPTASFTATPIAGYAPLEVSFDASASNDPNGPIVSYQWDFGDNGLDSGRVVNYTYQSTGSFTAQLIVIDSAGEADTVYQQILVEELPQEVLFITNQTSLNAGDALVKVRLEQMGYIVIVKDQETAVTSDAENKLLVLISSSISSSAVNTKFTEVSTPLLSWEAYLYDDLGMTAAVNGSGYGGVWGETNVEILDDAHVMAAGYSGSQEVLPSGNGLNWGNPSQEALRIASVPGDSSKALLFAYETGTQMAVGIAKARRVGIFLMDNSVPDLNETAWELFDMAVCWAVNCPEANPVNQAPIIDSIADQSHEQGTDISLMVVANDPEGDSIRFHAVGLPAGLSMDTISGEISGTLTDSIQTYAVSLFATDNGEPNEQSSMSFNWTIIEPIPNQPPVIEPIPNQTNEQGETAALQIQATDPEGDSLSYVSEGLPGGLSIDSLSGLISGIIADDSGNYAVMITVIDNGDSIESSSANFTWSVTLPPPNQAPICADLANQSNIQGASVSVFMQATDPDSINTLSFEAVGLPAGIVMNAQTGEMSGVVNAVLGTYQVSVTVSDDGTPIEACSVNFDWSVMEPPTNFDLLFVVKDTNLASGDAAVRSHLEATGYRVYLIDEGTASSADAEGKAAVVISSSVSSSQVNTKFTDVAVPLLSWEAYLYDDLKMTGPGFYSGYGITGDVKDITITNATHPLAAGLSGNVSLSDNVSGLAWGIPSTQALSIAQVASNASWQAIFAYEAGATMVGMNAPARRVGFGMRDQTATQMTVEGWALFDAAICWLISCEGQSRHAAFSDLDRVAIQLFPNPFTDQLSIVAEGLSNELVEISVADMVGRVQKTWRQSSTNGQLETNISLTYLPRGAYIIYIKSGSDVWRAKVIKQ